MTKAVLVLLADLVLNVWKRHSQKSHEPTRKHFRRHGFEGTMAALIVVQALNIIHSKKTLKAHLKANVERLKEECMVSTNT